MNAPKEKGSVRKDGRMPYGSGKPVLGRKFCKDCGRWRLLMDYYPEHKTHGIIVRFSSCCKTCDWRRQHKKLQTDAAARDRRREYDRIYKERQRREAGVPERNWLVGGARDRCLKRSSKVGTDATRFLKWLDDLVAEGGSIKALSRAVGIDDRRIREIRRTGRVSPGTVDAFLVAADSCVNLWELVD